MKRAQGIKPVGKYSAESNNDFFPFEKSDFIEEWLQ
jgi:hypothetical protein